jgi:hypothetical protein
MTTAVPSQEVQAKAGTYLCEGRVHIDYADQRAFVGLVTGTRSHPYLVMWAGGWRCDCPATATCSHIVACQAVWTPPKPPAPVWDTADPFARLPDYD